jgi:uncharacterized protein YdhG (YjbR/CyaY superfamily)
MSQNIEPETHMANDSTAKYSSIDDYNSALSADVKDIIEQIRKIIKSKVPDATETISYQMPAFQLGRTFIYFAAFKSHIGVYLPVQNDKSLLEELKPCQGEKGNLKFSLKQPIPYELIGKVAEALAKQYSTSQLQRLTRSYSALQIV